MGLIFKLAQGPQLSKDGSGLGTQIKERFSHQNNWQKVELVSWEVVMQDVILSAVAHQEVVAGKKWYLGFKQTFQPIKDTS